MIAPKLRFSEFKDEWIELSLKEYYSKIRNGFVGVATPFYVENGIKYLQGKNIKDGKIDPKGLIYISEDFHHKKNNSQLKQNDILMVQSGHVGECAVVTQDYENANCHALIILSPDHNEKVNSHFVVYYFYSHYGKKRISEIKTGNTIEHVLASEIKEVTLNFPTPKEQTKIAEFLSAVDDKISQLSRQLELLNQYKKGVMQKIFSQEIRFKNDNGEDFAGWQTVKLGNYLIKYDKKTTENNQYPVLTSSRNGIFFQKDYFAGQDVSSSDTTGYNIVPFGYFTYRHMSDDLIFKFNINNICENGIVSTLYPVFTVDEKYLNSQFLQTILNEGNEFKNFAIMQKQGGSRTYMYFSKLSELMITIPELKEQEKIAEFLTAIDKRIDHTTAQLTHTKQWKKGLLQQMFA